jgi:phage tail-like protein
MAKESGRDSDPLIGFNFGLDIMDGVKGMFTECSGLGSENEVVEHKVVDENGHESVQKIPGRMKFTDIVLKRGVTDRLDLWDWRADVEKGQMDKARVNGSIIMYDRNYKEIARWNFFNGWPSKISGPSLNSGSNDIAVEEVTIVHEGMERV